MIFRALAELTVVVHFVFILFVVLGALLVLRWPWMAWVHIPAFIWGALIEYAGFLCPLTPLENWLRHQAGDAGYTGGFINQYLVPVIYPAGLTRSHQIWLGTAVIALNIGLYAYILVRRRLRARRSDPGAP